MKKKIVSVCLVVCLLAIAIVGGTLAYFTDTDEATNTFTMGKVGITLTEDKWTSGSDALKVYPGQIYEKNPTITVDDNSEDCWLVATVTISNLSELKALYANDTTGVKQDWGLSLAGKGKMVTGGIAKYAAVGAQATIEKQNVSGTMLSKDGANVAFLTYQEVADTIVYTFYFQQPHKANDTEVLFEEVHIPAIIDNDDITGKLTVTVNAYAIQEVGFDDVYAAYAAYKTQEG